jgi:microcystin-dependent protein
MMFRKLSSMRSALRAMTAAVVLGSTSVGAMACGTDPYLGEICTFAFEYCPQGFLPANGSEQSIQQYTALYALLGTKFGGNGTSTFQLPDLRGRTPVGTGVGKGLNPVPIGQISGAEAAQLAIAHLPSHAHALSAQASGTVKVQVDALTTETTAPAPAPSASANTIGKIGTGSLSYYPYNATKAVSVPASVSMSASDAPANVLTLPVSGTVAPEGGSQLFSVLNPRLGVTFCIAAQGIFPSRP